MLDEYEVVYDGGFPVVFTPDTTAPTLSSASAGTPTSDGCTGAGVSTNEGNGTLYWAVLTDGGSCTDAQLKAGSGGDIVSGKAGNQAVSGTGSQVIADITGLSSGTDYEIVFLHRDGAGNDSAQAQTALATTGGATVLTIKSSGGDYTSVAAWEADTDNDLSGLGEIVGEVYDVNTTATIAIAGATNTSATDFRHLTVNSAYRHAGVWNTGKTNQQVSDGIDRIMQLGENYCKVSYWQAYNSSGSSSGVFDINANNCFIEQCLGWLNAGWGGNDASGVYMTGGDNATIRNSMFWSARNGIYIVGPSACVVENCATVANSNAGLRMDGSGHVARNHYSGGNGSQYEDSASNDLTWTCVTCMSSDSASSETGLTNNVAYTTSNFTSVTADAEDLHLTSGSALRGAGTDLSSSFTVDFDGQTRSAWDVGPDEFS